MPTGRSIKQDIKESALTKSLDKVGYILSPNKNKEEIPLVKEDVMS